MGNERCNEINERAAIMFSNRLVTRGFLALAALKLVLWKHEIT
jgi:hypothetical protein